MMTDSKPNEQVFRVTGMDCASCATNVEKGVARLDGVTMSSINFTTELLRVQGDVSSETVVARIREIGYDVADASSGETSHAASDFHSPNFLQFMWQRRETQLALLGAVLILPGLLFNELLPMLGWEHPFLNLTSVAALAVAGYPIALSALRTLRINREININLLMTIAAIGAVVIGAYTEAGLVMVLFAVGEALEGYTAGRARDSIRGLMALAPQEAVVLRPCYDCAGHLGQDGYTGGPCPFCGLEEHRVPIADLRVGETIVVKPGERVAMDGRILSGNSSVNQAPITGESRLVTKHAGDTVFASSINGEGTLEVEVTHLAEDNTISRLIQMVEAAQERRAPAQRFVDQFAKYYTPGVVLIAALVAAVPPLFFAAPFWNPAPGEQGWLYRALTLLVVACPCALVISTPVSLISAISNGARHGVLVKGGAYLEALAQVRAVAFDKTGTLTLGQPAVVAARSWQCTNPATGRCTDCDDLVALAHAVEQRSEHPLAQAVTAEAAARGVQAHYGAAQGVTALAGRGVTGMVNGRSVTIGSHAYFDDHQAHAKHCADLEAANQAGYTTMLVSADGAYQGYIAVADKVRGSSETAVSALKALGLTPLVMLTGDNETTAGQIAQQVGLTDVRANCLPEDKVTAVTQLRQQYDHVAMVGDGINDAPALATASVGIAIGRTAQAMETADVVLLGDDLHQLPFAIRLARAAMRTIYANVVLSLGIKLIFLILVLMGWGSMWLAVFADMGASLLVTLNGMRLLRRPTFDSSR
ncbi:MAG: cation-translocating P-type ATPase [Chloroflexota bacterium]